MIFHHNHLSYCTNIHNYSNTAELIRMLNGPVTEVASAFDGKAFAVGLHLNGTTVDELSNDSSLLEELQQTLDKNNMYVCSLNCFPHGTFHGERVKEKVYEPDWGTKSRVDYTIKAATILAELLPENIDGSISTVPVTYGKELPVGAIENIATVCSHLQSLSRRVVLAFEPEPDCYLDCVNDCIQFFTLLKNELSPDLYDFTGICFDTCHFSVIFEKPAVSLQQLIDSEILVPKVQISAALKTRNPQLLKQFNEPIYLHQTTLKNSHGLLIHYPDLDLALKKGDNIEDSEWRVHFHVPIYCDQLMDNLATTADDLPNVMKIVNKMANLHLEVETYSFNVIPNNCESVTNSIIKELKYLIST